MKRKPPAERGFTLLEAIVALAIFASVGMALYGTYNTNLISMERVRDTSRQLPAVRNAMEYLSTVNPHEEPEGQLTFNGFDIRWAATLVEPVRQGQDAFGYRTNYELGLYDVRFDVSEDGQPLGSWNLRVVGHRSAIAPLPDGFDFR